MYGFLILVVKLFWLHHLVLMRYDEPIVIRVLLAHNLGNIETSKWNYVWGVSLLPILINKESMIPQDVVTSLHPACPLTDFEKFTIFDDHWIFWDEAIPLNLHWWPHKLRHATRCSILWLFLIWRAGLVGLLDLHLRQLPIIILVILASFGVKFHILRYFIFLCRNLIYIGKAILHSWLLALKSIFGNMLLTTNDFISFFKVFEASIR